MEDEKPLPVSVRFPSDTVEQVDRRVAEDIAAKGKRNAASRSSFIIACVQLGLKLREMGIKVEEYGIYPEEGLFNKEGWKKLIDEYRKEVPKEQ